VLHDEVKIPFVPTSKFRRRRCAQFKFLSDFALIGPVFSIPFCAGHVDRRVAAKGSIIEFDDANGTGTRAEGLLRKQDPSSFATADFQGNYAFELAGRDSAGGRFVIGGALTAASGALSNGTVDSNDAGVTTLN
jgi:hypothetical protein